MKIRLSRKNPNLLFQNEINTKDNKSKTSNKLFTKENIAIKRNSVSIPNFFDDTDESIKTLKIISNYYSNNISMFHFIKIYCKHINNPDDAIDIFRNIKNIYNIRESRNIFYN